MRNWLCSAVMLLAVLAAALAASGSDAKGLVNTEVKRNIYLWSPIAKHEYTISVTNEASSPASTYDLAINEEVAKNMASLTVSNENVRVLPWKVDEQVRSVQAPNGDIIARYASLNEAPISGAQTPLCRSPTFSLDFGLFFKSHHAS